MPAPRPSRRENQPPSLKPLEFLLLTGLAAGERHGYALKKDVVQRTGGKVRPGPATLYRALAALAERGWIAESSRRPAPELDDERRRYYRITESGRRIVLAEAKRLESLAAAARAAVAST
jgi:DNA-binding PadR family transcriptional regulator